jgi:imidazolonepropionase-like amidohydrolase
MRRQGAELGLSRFGAEKLATVLEAGLRSVELALRAGVRVGFGTDLLGDLHEHQSEEFVLRAQVQKPHEVIAAATAVNAEILGMSGKLGVIAPGAFGDLIAVDGNPLVDLGLLQEQGRHIDLVMKGGQVLVSRL